MAARRGRSRALTRVPPPRLLPKRARSQRRLRGGGGSTCVWKCIQRTCFQISTELHRISTDFFLSRDAETTRELTQNEAEDEREGACRSERVLAGSRPIRVRLMCVLNRHETALDRSSTSLSPLILDSRLSNLDENPSEIPPNALYSHAVRWTWRRI